MGGPDKDLWRKAMDTEFGDFKIHIPPNTLVEAPKMQIYWGECGSSPGNETSITVSSSTRQDGLSLGIIRFMGWTFLTHMHLSASLILYEFFYLFQQPGGGTYYSST